MLFRSKARRTVVENGRGNGPEIVGVAGVDLLGVVPVCYRRERSGSNSVIELEGDISHGARVRAQVVGLDRAGDVVRVRRRAEAGEGIRLVGPRDDVVVSGGIDVIAEKSQVCGQLVGGFPHQPQSPRPLPIRVRIAVEVSVVQVTVGVVEVD